jgi:hypothetical protein
MILPPSQPSPKGEGVDASCRLNWDLKNELRYDLLKID